MDKTINVPKLLKGGELGTYQNVISHADHLQVWFKPVFSGELGKNGLKPFEQLISIKVNYIPLSGNSKEFNGSISVASSDTKILFGIAEKTFADFISETVGTLFIKAIEKDDKGEIRVLSDTDLEIPVAAPTERPMLFASQVVNSMSEMASRDVTDVNVLKSTHEKDAIAVLFKIIEDSTNCLSYKNYEKYVNSIFCDGETDKAFKALNKRRYLPFNDTDSYRILKIATEAFLMLNAGVCCNFDDIDSEASLIEHLSGLDIRFAGDDKKLFQTLWDEYKIKEDGILILPYLYIIRQKFADASITSTWIDSLIEEKICGCEENLANELKEKCFGIVKQRLQCPLFIELIWSYWQEEGMLVQSMNAITRRFQNMKTVGKNDPLAEMEISHLRPLNNLMWGYIQDEQHRLSIIRRAYEYDHHYGITIEGRAVPVLNSADSRTRFIEAFHSLLNLTAKYYIDTANKLVDPDPFPLLNGLREVHFIIAEGMHNQYGDLPSTARIEMLMQQWILARPEFREFLPGRAAIPFTEPWMDRVASMNKLQGWADVSPMHFDYLAKYGEQILISIRFADWSNQSRTRKDAALWANYFRNQIQGYIHSYKAATGVDLTTTLVGNKIDARPPSYHLAQRLKTRQNGVVPKPSQKGIPIKDPVKKEFY